MGKGGFPGGGFGGGNMQQILKQAQKMQADMQRAQEELKNSEVTGSAAGGMVEITMTGDKEVTAVKIKKRLTQTISKCWKTLSSRPSTTPSKRLTSCRKNLWDRLQAVWAVCSDALYRASCKTYCGIHEVRGRGRKDGGKVRLFHIKAQRQRSRRPYQRLARRQTKGEIL